jgi:hypothetical protein
MIKKDGVMMYLCLVISTLWHLQQFLPCGGDNGKLHSWRRSWSSVSRVKTLGLTLDGFTW